MLFICLQDTANLCDDLSQPRVAHNKPAARSDAVGLVLKLMWLHFIEILETADRKKNRWLCDDAVAHKSIEYLTIGHYRQVHAYFCTYIVAFRMSECIWATPLTAWEPTMHKWAMLILFCPPSSTRDIRHRRWLSPGYLAATFCKS